MSDNEWFPDQVWLVLDYIKVVDSETQIIKHAEIKQRLSLTPPRPGQPGRRYHLDQGGEDQ